MPSPSEWPCGRCPVTEPFDPRIKLIHLPRRVKDPQTGQWVTRLDEYLEVKWRLVWFRERYPHGAVETEFLHLDWDQGLAICKATVGDGEGGLATGTGTETRKGFEDFVEKSETRAIGRALAALGIGTQFVGAELDEGDHIADAPVVSSQGGGSTPTLTPEVTTTSDAADHPTEAQILALQSLALTECHEDKEVYHDRI